MLDPLVSEEASLFLSGWNQWQNFPEQSKGNLFGVEFGSVKLVGFYKLLL